MSERQEPEVQGFKAGEDPFANLGREDEPATREPDPARAEAMARASDPEMTAAAERQHAANHPMEKAAAVIKDGEVVGYVGAKDPKEEAIAAKLHRIDGERRANRAG